MLKASDEKHLRTECHLYRPALACGVTSIVCIALIQAFSSFTCYEHSLEKYLEVLGFIALPMLPAIVALLTRNPQRAVGASLFFAPWLLFAYYTDCVRPYEGGGASMIYVAVALWGLPSAIIGALLTPKLSHFTKDNSAV